MTTAGRSSRPGRSRSTPGCSSAWPFAARTTRLGRNVGSHWPSPRLGQTPTVPFVNSSTKRLAALRRMPQQRIARTGQGRSHLRRTRCAASRPRAETPAVGHYDSSMAVPMSMNRVIHSAVRRDLDRLGRVAGRVPGGRCVSGGGARPSLAVLPRRAEPPSHRRARDRVVPVGGGRCRSGDPRAVRHRARRDGRRAGERG